MLRFIAPSMKAAVGSSWQARHPDRGFRETHLKNIGGVFPGASHKGRTERLPNKACSVPLTAARERVGASLPYEQECLAPRVSCQAKSMRPSERLAPTWQRRHINRRWLVNEEPPAVLHQVHNCLICSANHGQCQGTTPAAMQIPHGGNLYLTSL